MSNYTRLFEEAGVTPPSDLGRLAKLHHRIEKLTRGGNLAQLDVTSLDPGKVTQTVRAAAQKDLEAELIAQVWSQTRVGGGWLPTERGWVTEIEDAAHRVFLQHADSLIEARQAEFDEAVSELAQVTSLIGANPDSDQLLQEGTEAQTDAYQRRGSILQRLAAIHSWRLDFFDTGYGANRTRSEVFTDDVLYEAVVWFLDPEDARSVEELDHAEEIWADSGETQGNRFAQLLEQGFHLKLNTADDAGALYVRRETAKAKQRQQVEEAVKQFQSVDEVNQWARGEMEVMARTHGSWTNVPQEKKDEIARRKTELLDEIGAAENAWVVS